VGPGNGGDGAAGAAAGGSSGAGGLYAQAFVNVPSVTVMLRSFVLSQAPEPFLLSLERPG
jgi:hypothetical protein